MKTLLSAVVLCFLVIAGHPGTAQVHVTVVQNNTRCDIPNGAASASVGGLTEGYTFDWYDIAFNYISSGSTISNLEGGNYMVIVTDQSSGVNLGVTQIQISSEMVLPVVMLESIPNTSCTGAANGALITSVEGDPSDYSYKWYQGSDPAGSLISSATHLTDRSAGGYTLVVTNLITGCSTRLTSSIADEPAIPVVNIVVTNNTNCTGSPNGTLNAVTEESAQQYSFAWYDNSLNPLGVTSHLIDHRAAGNYVVTVTDGVTGCISSTTAVINDDCNYSAPGFSDAANDVVTNEKKAGDSGIGYYPNPASETLWVSSIGPAALVLINNRGEIVLRQNVYLTDTPFALDVSELKPGKYILKANQGGAVSNFQIILKK